MKTNEKYQLLKSSLEFTVEIIRYSQLLELNHRKTIAQKLLQAGLKINTYIYEAQTAILNKDLISKLDKARKSLEEALYWFLQCVNSRYFDEDPRIIRKANALLKEISAEVTVG